MKRLKFLIVFICALVSQIHINAQVQTPRYVSINSNTKGFYEYLPQGYSSTSTQKYPFILFVHGMGELGDGSTSNLPKVLNNGIPRVINQGKFPTSFTVNNQTHRFVVLSPQFVQWPTSNDLEAVISYAINNYNIDPSRIYLSGLSMGGGAVWEYGGNEINASYPKRVAAMVPVCGAAYPSKYRAQIMVDNDIAVWAFHNDGDPTVPLFYTVDFVNYINNVVPTPDIPAKKTIFVSNSHDAWTKAYDPSYREDGKNMYEWMLQYSKGTVPPPPSNTPPIVNAGADQAITLPLNSVQLNATASDPNGSISAYEWTKVSGPSSFTINNSAANNPVISNLIQGTYTFRLTVTDNQSAKSSDDIVITVNPATTTPPTGTSKSIKVNLFGGTNAYNNTEWNNWNTFNSLSSGNLKYNDGAVSAISATISQTSVSDNGPSYSSTMAPTEVMRYASYSTSRRDLVISGLDNSKTYSLELYASRNGATNNSTRFNIGATTIDIKTDNNTSAKAVFNSIAPQSGKITISIDKLNTYNYLNGFVISETGSASQNTPPVANAGSDQTIVLPVNSVQLQGTGSDADGSIAAYQWSKISGPSSFTFSNASIANPAVNNLVEGTYVFRLTVTDNKNATTSDDISITVNPAISTPPSTSRLIKANIFGGTNPYNNSEWNNWNTFSTLSSGNLKYSDGASSGVTASISQNSVSDNGPSYNATIAPPEVIRYASYSTSRRTLTLAGLDNSKTYDLDLFASRSGATNNTTRFISGSTTIDIKTDNNLSQKASFSNLTPQNGQIVITIDKLNVYNYLNGFILYEKSGTVATSARMLSESTASSASISIYPNPVTDRFVLQINNTYTGQMKAQIINMSGGVQKEIYLTKAKSGISQNYLQIGELPVGEYIIRIQAGDLIETGKIIKQ